MNKKEINSIVKKFKKEFWENDKDNINAIIKELEITFIENTETKEIEISSENYVVDVYVFDVEKAKDFPSEIDGVKFRYLKVPVEDKKE